MKKLLAILLSLMLLCAFATAEEPEGIVFDPAIMEQVPGQFMALEDYGLMIYVPEDMFSYEMTEEDKAAGCYAILIGGEGAIGLTIARTMVTDAEGNQATDHASIAATYTAMGMSGVSIGTVNGLGCIGYARPEAGLMGLDLVLTDGSVLNFIFTGVVDDATNVYASVVLSSIMPLQYAE